MTWLAASRRRCRSYKSLQDIIAILGMDELSEEDKSDRRPRPQDPEASSASRSTSPKCSPASAGKFVQVKDTVEVVQGGGRRPVRPPSRESAFYMVGGIDEAVAKAEKDGHRTRSAYGRLSTLAGRGLLAHLPLEARARGGPDQTELSLDYNVPPPTPPASGTGEGRR